jgi:mono/diheme cytochrome c family protein
VQKEATEGDLAWLLKNGNLGKGMPTWDTIPEPSRWEIIAYVRSLGPSSAASGAAAAPANSKQEKTQ